MEAVEPEPCNYEATQKGHQKLLDQLGFHYLKDKTSYDGKRQIWKCQWSKKAGCKARVHTIEGFVVSRSRVRHTHEPDVDIL